MILWYLSLFSLWFGPILCFYATFLRQSCYLIALMSAMLGHFSALFLLSVLCHYLQFGFELSDQVRAGTVPVWGRGTVEYVLCRGGGLPAAWKRMMTLLRHCPWLWLVVLIHERWILASDWMSSGGHWVEPQWVYSQLTCTAFYCQIIMTILANITNKSYRPKASCNICYSNCIYV